MITDDEFPSEDRLESIINFEIDQFKSLKHETLSRYDRDYCVINKIRWTDLASINDLIISCFGFLCSTRL